MSSHDNADTTELDQNADEPFPRTPTTLSSRKRTISEPFMSNKYSVKRRRVSMASMDIENMIMGSTSSSKPTPPMLDRFVPASSSKPIPPLSTTPRTQRISRQLGLISSDRILNLTQEFTHAASSSSATGINVSAIDSSSSENSKMFQLLRTHAATLFQRPPPTHPTSVRENLCLTKRPTLSLDAPRITNNPFSYPISWSRKNLIAVACQQNVYYQNLDTRVVSFFFSSSSMPVRAGNSHSNTINTIEWGSGPHTNLLASGTLGGVVRLCDAVHISRGGDEFLRVWCDEGGRKVSSLSWNGSVLGAGSKDGTISLFDVRTRDLAHRFYGSGGDMIGLKWNHPSQVEEEDGSVGAVWGPSTYLASSDSNGMVYVWDMRASKLLTDEGVQGPAMRHNGPVKALAWCPWKPDLLATGSASPDGKIHVWSIKEPSTAFSQLALRSTTASSSSSRKSHIPTPVLSLSLSTPVYSLLWSPHCKELLSTHGASSQPVVPPSESTSSQGLGHAQRLRQRIQHRRERRGAFPTATATVTVPTTTTTPTTTPNTTSTTPPSTAPSSLSHSITVHDFPSGKRLCSIRAGETEVVHSVLGPSGERVFTVGPREQTIKMWDVWKAGGSAAGRGRGAGEGGGSGGGGGEDSESESESESGTKEKGKRRRHGARSSWGGGFEKFRIR